MSIALLTALGLMLVIEGLLPFMNPRGFKRTLAAVCHAQDRILRTAGLISMMAGLALLYLARGVL
ncbi:MAG TPA: DUF2065 domain-containing protein [Gammaproteobacteria bacterium]